MIGSQFPESLTIATCYHTKKCGYRRESPAPGTIHRSVRVPSPLVLSLQPTLARPCRCPQLAHAAMHRRARPPSLLRLRPLCRCRGPVLAPRSQPRLHLGKREKNMTRSRTTRNGKKLKKKIEKKGQGELANGLWAGPKAAARADWGYRLAGEQRIHALPAAWAPPTPSSRAVASRHRRHLTLVRR